MNSPTIQIKHVHLHLPPLPIGTGALLAAMSAPSPTSDRGHEPKARFELISDGTGLTVTDHRTGLMWSAEESATRMNFSEAEKHCAALRLGGFDDWRLPDLEELESIRDLTRHEPCLDTGVFKSNSSWVWSRTPTAWSSDYAWIVHFSGGGVDRGPRYGTAFVRAVRRVAPASQ